MARRGDFEGDPFWYKDAIIYELPVKAFYDGNNDGTGDFRGLTMKLDYLKDLGITALWLLPFYPSPLRDDGYDISDLLSVHPLYGTLRDFREFLREAHKREIRVITELVLNHTSDQHPWFQRARRAKPGSSHRNFYVWSDDPQKYADARIIFKDFETSNWTWDPVAGAYYWHRFYSHQPDLNYDNPAVQKAILQSIDFWMREGVDGMRLDAVPYLFEREGTNCENLPETYAFLRKLRAHVDANFEDRVLLAEANQWPEDAAAYFGSGDMCNMAFHFPLMPRMFMALETEDNFPLIDILNQTPPIPDNCQWALFLRNHDELTLEMVTDQERDYMYRIYARDPEARINLGIRRRLAPMLDNDHRKMKLLFALLVSLPGTPVIYYGNELGMGDNYHLGDRDGVRTPMQWSPDRNAGFSRADPQQLYLPTVIDYGYHYQTLNVETEEKSAASFLWFTRRVIALRKRHKAFGRGSLKIVPTSNNKIFAFIREYENEKILIAVNLSRLPQMSTLELSGYAGLVPEEFMSRNRFHRIEQDPYVLTFSPYGIFALLLGRAEAHPGQEAGEVLEVDSDWKDVFRGKHLETLENKILPRYVSGCRWFNGRMHRKYQIRIPETVPFSNGAREARIVLMNVEFSEGLPEFYIIPIGFAEGVEAARLWKKFPSAVIARITVGGRDGVLFDSMYGNWFAGEILRLIAGRKSQKLNSARLSAFTGTGLNPEHLKRNEPVRPSGIRTETNASVLFGKDYFLKLYRHPDRGTNPDLELNRFLTEKVNFRHVPAFAGGIELQLSSGESFTVGILQRYVHHQGSALGYFLSGLSRFYVAVLGRTDHVEVPQNTVSLLDLASGDIPIISADLPAGVSEEVIALLGVRTAQMHLALAGAKDPEMAPEDFSTLYQRSVLQAIQSHQKRVFESLSAKIAQFPRGMAPDTTGVLTLGDRILSIYRRIMTRKFSAKRIRVHGNYHLGHVLYTGKDFVIIDFEGDPNRPAGERRIKLSPLMDVAGMIRSFHYAAYRALFTSSEVRHKDIPVLEPWAELWHRTMAAVFLRSYLDTMNGSRLIPENRDDLEILLSCFLLDKAVDELGYELRNRPDWVCIPARGIRYLVESAGAPGAYGGGNSSD